MARKKTTNSFEIPSLQDITPIPGFHSDYGGWALRWVCPRCGDTLTWSPVMDKPLTCQCGTWELSLQAVCDGIPVPAPVQAEPEPEAEAEDIQEQPASG